jgi:hypothetical protein
MASPVYSPSWLISALRCKIPAFSLRTTHDLETQYHRRRHR